MHFLGWKLSIFEIGNYAGFQKQAYFVFQRYDKALKNNNEIISLELLISANHLPLSDRFFVLLEVQSIWVWSRYVNSRLKDPPHPHPYICLANPSPNRVSVIFPVLCFWKIVTCLLSEKCTDNTRSFCDVKNEFSMTVHYLLIQDIKECALFKWHVFHASTRQWCKKLERVTRLKEDPGDKTRFVVADTTKSSSIGTVLRASTIIWNSLNAP